MTKHQSTKSNFFCYYSVFCDANIHVLNNVVLFLCLLTGEMIARRLDQAMAKYNAGNQQGVHMNICLATSCSCHIVQF